ncbi:Membrane protein YndG [Planctomycetales bacterium 10988]|nr:Membrane protein YndG [Planctomycetales bacterium 10988]
MSIYVEARINGPLEELWEKTQCPQLHERWDARFTSIEYLPREQESSPQRFLYATRIGFGLAVNGEGETVSDRTNGRGERTSSLRFWSEDPKSLIRIGSGYWKYIPDKNGIRFITGYNYQTRFGWLGRTFDRLCFRPLMGWATAWSFDRLRLWIEQDIDPATSLRNSLIHAISRFAVAVVWLYQGLIPKLIAVHSDELTMLTEAGISQTNAPFIAASVGILEALIGVYVLCCLRSRWPFVLTICLMVLATIGVFLNSPQYLMAAFNPISLNLLLATVSLIGLLTLRDLPSARRCLRTKPEIDA